MLPGTDAAAAASAAAAATAHTAGRLVGGPGVGAAGRGPRVLGGPGVGTPLPEGEPVHPAPHDIEAAHGPAAEQAEGARGGDHAQLAEHVGQPGHLGQAGHAEHAGHAEPAGHAVYAEPAGHVGTAGTRGTASTRTTWACRARAASGHRRARFHVLPRGAGAGRDRRARCDRRRAAGGFRWTGSLRLRAGRGGVRRARAARRHRRPRLLGLRSHDGARPGTGTGPVPAPAEAHDAAPGAETAAPEPDDADGHGPAETGAAAAEVPADRTPGEDTADSASELPDEGTGERLPAAVPTYEKETGTGADAHHEHPHASYVLRVNGADRPVTGAWIGESLLYVLRERLGLAGAKDGCSQGECGACAVQVDGRLVASCLVPAATAAGSEVRTVEGLATNGELSDVQQALCRSGAVQCGFCVPGMAMTIHDLLEGNHAPSELETRQALCGNLCRCSGYSGVIDAVREVVSEREAAASEPVPQAPQGPQAPQAAQALSEPRIPHQAAPGEGGIHHGGTA
ncbi:2Fe-2S iron-sulfur cluster-binding protein [Streptomyces sp. MS1.HAVA.3]|uniref:2Fe-2S iron-sulfur cluster-binding protein n=1 Tax=Streptomyces caledonius TaxID=3134107 RepID=A0ABU8UA00_9ACTN